MNPSNPNQYDGDRGCGDRLRKAREAAGLSLTEVGARLKMPVRVVESLENEDWSRLGAPVFVRGQLRSYSRLLGLSTSTMQAAVNIGRVEPIALVPRTFTPPMQRFAEHAMRRLVYIVITAAIVVPVWLATQNHLKAPAPESAPLDLPTQGGLQGARAPATGQDANASQPATLVASITPMPQRPAATPALSLVFERESWVQIVAPDGRTVEQALVPAGQRRDYAVGQVARVVLGDASAVAVKRHGQAYDLAPFLRANVARFAVSSDGSLAPIPQ